MSSSDFDFAAFDRQLAERYKANGKPRYSVNFPRGRWMDCVSTHDRDEADRLAAGLGASTRGLVTIIDHHDEEGPRYVDCRPFGTRAAAWRRYWTGRAIGLAATLWGRLTEGRGP